MIWIKAEITEKGLDHLNKINIYLFSKIAIILSFIGILFTGATYIKEYYKSDTKLQLPLLRKPVPTKISSNQRLHDSGRRWGRPLSDCGQLHSQKRQHHQLERGRPASDGVCE